MSVIEDHHPMAKAKAKNETANQCNPSQPFAQNVWLNRQPFTKYLGKMVHHSGNRKVGPLWDLL
jgi:hypothetical protein